MESKTDLRLGNFGVDLYERFLTVLELSVVLSFGPSDLKPVQAAVGLDRHSISVQDRNHCRSRIHYYRDMTLRMCALFCPASVDRGSRLSPTECSRGTYLRTASFRSSVARSYCFLCWTQHEGRSLLPSAFQFAHSSGR